MELLCPHCFKRVTVADDRAGQAVNCPACSKVFSAPAMSPALQVAAPPPPVSPPPSTPGPVSPGPVVSAAPAHDTYGISPHAPPVSPPPVTPASPQLPPLPSSTTATAPKLPPRPVAPPPPPPPPGPYTATLTLRLNAEVLAWIVPVALGLIFLLSFFPWRVEGNTTGSFAYLSLWNLAFGQYGTTLFLVYVLLTIFLALPLSVLALLLDLRIVPAPAAVAQLVPWKWAIVSILSLVGFAALLYEFVHENFYLPTNPMMVAMKIAFRLHLLALIAAALGAWLQARRARNLPLPAVDVRW